MVYYNAIYSHGDFGRYNKYNDNDNDNDNDNNQISCQPKWSFLAGSEDLSS